MRTLIQYGLLATVLWLSAGCERLLMGPDPIRSPQQNFDLFWSTFDENYAFLAESGVDWDAAYQTYRARLTSTTTDQELFNLLAELSLLFKDGHITLASPYGTVYYDAFLKGPRNQLASVSRYVSTLKRVNAALQYGDVAGTTLGYIAIPTFGLGTASPNNPAYLAIDAILAAFRNTSGLIIDVRSNGGGSSANAKLITSRFTTQSFIGSQFRQKNGPQRTNFTDWYPDRIEPGGSAPYTKPVIVLTNRPCFSATEYFILTMRALPNVRTVGDTTGGGGGIPAPFELPNGFVFRLPTTEIASARRDRFQFRGLYPDVPVRISRADSLANRDTLLERAIDLLQ